MWEKLQQAFGDGSSASTSPKLLSSVNYYHYYVPREEVEELLTTQGDFLVRAIITKEAKIAVILSVRGKDKIEHFVADYKPLENEVGKGMFYFVKSVGRPSLPDLVEYHMNRKVAVNGFVLKRPVGRSNYEILSNRVKFDGTKILGEGNFAVVTKGTFNVLANNTIMNVACKRIRVEKCKSQFDKLEAKRQIVREVHIGRILQGHPHILSIYGMFVETEELAVISELCDGGSVESFLKKSRDVSPLAKLNFLYHAADGLAYMHYNSLIHRDISGRNLLLVKREKSNLLPLIKVADFGLTRMGPVYKMTIQHEVPFLVSAVECLVDDAQWTFKSDCWSFGVLMWELFNNCMAEPYSAEGVHLDTGMLLDALKQGLRLRVTTDMQMPAEAETLMKDCFEIDPNRRPAMKEIRSRLHRIVKQAST